MSVRWIRLVLSVLLLILGCWFGFKIARYYHNQTEATRLEQIEQLKTKQLDLIQELQLAKARSITPEQMKLDLATAFNEGKKLASVKTIPKEVIKYETKPETVYMNHECPEQVKVKAVVTEATIEDIAGQPWLMSKVTVKLDDLESNFHRSIDLQPDPKTVDFRILPKLASNNAELTIPQKKFHFGKSIGCGVGFVADVNAWPTTSAGVGVGVFCGVTFGIVK